MTVLPRVESGRKARLIIWAATGLGTGFAPFAPGTAGTLVGIPCVLLLSLLPWPLYLLSLIALTGLAVYLAQAAELRLGKKDPPCIVIDEIVGFLWTLFALPLTWQSIIFGFLFFRFFDIVKPFPVRLLQDKLPGGYGIVGDDIMAGIYSNAALHILWQFSVL